MSLMHMQMVMGESGGLGLYEPSGTWIGKNDDGQVLFSRDGRNWWYDEYNAFSANSSYFGALDPTTNKYICLSLDVSTEVLQSDNIAADPPTWAGASGGDGIGLCQWIAVSTAGKHVAQTSISLRHSNNGILWTDEDSSLPASWNDANTGMLRWSETANLFIQLGSTFNAVGSEAKYWTSANGTTWTARTFPMDWQANGQLNNLDYFLTNGTIDVIVMKTGQIYSSTDCINWTLRETTGFTFGGAVYNAGLDEFYAVNTQSGVNKLYSSTDGTAWNPKTLNDLSTIIGGTPQIAADPVSGLMIVMLGGTTWAWNTQDFAVSEDGVTWYSWYGPNGANHVQHVPGKYGPVIDDTLVITPDPITITDGAVSSPTQSYAAIYHNRDGRVQSRTSTAGYVSIGTWHNEGTSGLSWAGREVRLDYVSGDVINKSGSEATGSWLSAYAADWGLITTGVEAKSGVFTLRYRDKVTGIEDTNGGVTVTLTAEAT